ncbi:MAG: acylphosphatase [Thermoplasmata archaeon]
MKVKKRLVLDGEVQGVGLRAFAKRLALRMKLKGCARNLEDGTVEIYIEGEQEKIEKFKAILQSEQTRSFGIIVESIMEFDEGTEGFGTPPEYKGFKIIYDYKVEPAMEELLERTEMIVIGGQELKAGINLVANKVDCVAEKVDRVAEKVDKVAEKVDAGNKMLAEKMDKVEGGIKMLAEKIDSMHADMNERFDRIEAKYGVLSETLLGFMQEFRNFNVKLDEHNQKLDLILEKLVALEDRKHCRRLHDETIQHD